MYRTGTNKYFLIIGGYHVTQESDNDPTNIAASQYLLSMFINFE
jgi:hypothetical protein